MSQKVLNTYIGKKTIWYAYSIVLILLCSGRMIERILADSGGFASRYLPLALALVVVLGIYGSINGKPFLKPWFWRLIYLFLMVISIVGCIYSIYLLALVGGGSTLGAIGMLMAALMLIPGVLRLKLYAKMPNEFWKK